METKEIETMEERYKGTTSFITFSYYLQGKKGEFENVIQDTGPGPFKCKDFTFYISYLKQLKAGLCLSLG